MITAASGWAVLCAFYSCILLRLWMGVRALRSGIEKTTPSVSVVVAARNEAAAIRNCLASLSAQNYPFEKIEFFIVDDRSEDDTAAIIDEFCLKDNRFHRISVKRTPHNYAPKKWALHQAIEASTSEIILTTDADCVAPPEWVSKIVQHFSRDVGLVAGYAPLDLVQKPTLFQRLIQLDALALASVAAGSFGAGFPLTCSGRNLAYRRKVFDEIGGFEAISHFVSGDDDLMLHRVQQETTWNMKYAAIPEISVSSAPHSELSALFHQRTRHASKGFHYPLYLTLSLAVVYLFNLTLLLGPFFIRLWPLWIMVIIIKSSFEFLLIQSAALKLGESRLLKYFPMTVVPHIVYVVFFGLWGQIGRFHWKDTVMEKNVKSMH